MPRAKKSAKRSRMEQALDIICRSFERRLDGLEASLDAIEDSLERAQVKLPKANRKKSEAV